MRRTFRTFIILLLLLALLPFPAQAKQDFYGEGNVLIAVDMAPYAQNEAVSYPEGTLGTLQWGPDAPITREQLVTMLWRLSGEPALGADLSGFADAGEISDWAEAAMRWAVGVGLMQGRGGGVLAPDGEATRAEVAVLIQSYCEIVR